MTGDRIVGLLKSRQRGLENIRYRLKSIAAAVDDATVPVHSVPIFQNAAAHAAFTFNYQMDEKTRVAALSQSFRNWVKSVGVPFPQTEGEWRTIAAAIKKALQMTDAADDQRSTI